MTETDTPMTPEKMQEILATLEKLMDEWDDGDLDLIPIDEPDVEEA